MSTHKMWLLEQFRFRGNTKKNFSVFFCILFIIFCMFLLLLGFLWPKVWGLIYSVQDSEKHGVIILYVFASTTLITCFAMLLALKQNSHREILSCLLILLLLWQIHLVICFASLVMHTLYSEEEFKIATAVYRTLPLLCVQGNKFVKKWRNIKDNYNKSIKKRTKSGQAADSGRRYIYSKQLSFLETARTATKTESSLECNEEGEHSEEQSRKNMSHIETPDKPPRCEQNSFRKRKREIESSLIEFRNAPIPCSPVLTECNPDKSFFDSIIPSIASFTEDQKLEFRSEVLNIIKRIRMSRQIQHMCPSFTHLTPTPHSFLYLPQAQSSTQPLTEVLPHRCPASASQPHIPVTSPSTSNCTSVDNNRTSSEEDSLDLF